MNADLSGTPTGERRSIGFNPEQALFDCFSPCRFLHRADWVLLLVKKTHLVSNLTCSASTFGSNILYGLADAPRSPISKTGAAPHLLVIKCASDFPNAASL